MHPRTQALWKEAGLKISRDGGILEPVQAPLSVTLAYNYKVTLYDENTDFIIF
jgi:hypothetical protein